MRSERAGSQPFVLILFYICTFFFRLRFYLQQKKKLSTVINHPSSSLTISLGFQVLHLNFEKFLFRNLATSSHVAQSSSLGLSRWRISWEIDFHRWIRICGRAIRFGLRIKIWLGFPARCSILPVARFMSRLLRGRRFVLIWLIDWLINRLYRRRISVSSRSLHRFLF